MHSHILRHSAELAIPLRSPISHLSTLPSMSPCDDHLLHEIRRLEDYSEGEKSLEGNAHFVESPSPTQTLYDSRPQAAQDESDTPLVQPSCAAPLPASAALPSTVQLIQAVAMTLRAAIEADSMCGCGCIMRRRIKGQA
ncbi:hypothetical protein MHYP_G00134220 [Metynnis hypsauchen]